LIKFSAALVQFAAIDYVWNDRHDLIKQFIVFFTDALTGGMNPTMTYFTLNGFTIFASIGTTFIAMFTYIPGEFQDFALIFIGRGRILGWWFESSLNLA